MRGVSSASCCAPGTCDAVVDCGFSVVDCDEAFVVPDLAWMDGVSRAWQGLFRASVRDGVTVRGRFGLGLGDVGPVWQLGSEGTVQAMFGQCQRRRVNGSSDVCARATGSRDDRGRKDCGEGSGLCEFGGPLWRVCDDPVDVHLCSPEDLLCPVEACGVDKDEVSADWAHEQERCEELAHCGRLSLALWSGRHRSTTGGCGGHLLAVCDPAKVCALEWTLCDEGDELLCAFPCDGFADDDPEMIDCETPGVGGHEVWRGVI